MSLSTDERQALREGNLAGSLAGLATQLRRMIDGAAFVKDGYVRVRDPDYLITRLEHAAKAIPSLLTDLEAAEAKLDAVTQERDEANRDDRQRRVAEWCAAAFGAEHQSSVPQRGLRMLEEAIEAYQALGGSQEQAHKLIDYIFAKEPGALFQELGDLGVTVLALAQAAGVSADDAEKAEFNRVLAKPLEWFHARNKAKNDAGFDATAYPAARAALTQQEHSDESPSPPLAPRLPHGL